MTNKIIFVLILMISLSSFGIASATTIQASSLSISEVGKSVEIPLVIDSLPAGLAGYKMVVGLSPSGIAQITDVTMPDWAGLKNVNATFPADSAQITAVDLADSITSGATSIPIATVTVEGLAEGTTELVLTVSELTDDSGDSVSYETDNAVITVEGSNTASEVTPTPTQTPVVAEMTSQPTAVSTVAPVDLPTTTEPTQEPAETVLPQATPSPVPTIIVNFTADVTSGPSPMTVSFTDLSSGYPEKFLWNFGDNSSDSTSVVQNPTHIYRIPGIYSVSLNASNSEYSNETTRENYIVAASMRMPQRGDKTSMTIYSVPDGAECYLNNAYQGITPVNVTNLTPRTYQLRLHKEGYYDIVDPVIANNGVLPTFVSGYEMVPHYAEIGKLVADPVQTGAAYIVTYPELVTAYIDDNKVGLTDVMVLNLAVGTHNLTLVKDGFTNWTDTLDVKNGLGVIQTYTYEGPYYPPTNKTIEYVDMSS